jgi:ABC-type nickel/cobalt efflux system permease component RcnA
MIGPGILAEAIFGHGLALAGANVVALVRPVLLRRRGRKNVQGVGSRSRSYVNIFIGLVVMVWGLASMLRWY